MSRREDRQQVLSQIEGGEISPSEGIARLAALDAQPPASEPVEVEMDVEDSVEPEPVIETVFMDDAAPDLPGAAGVGSQSSTPVSPAAATSSGQTGSASASADASDPHSDAAPRAAEAGPRKLKLKIERHGDASQPESGSVRWLKLRVRDGASGSDRVKLNLPLGFVEAGLRMLERVDPDGDWPRLQSAFREGGVVKLLEVEGDDGEQVEITVE